MMSNEIKSLKNDRTRAWSTLLAAGIALLAAGIALLAVVVLLAIAIIFS